MENNDLANYDHQDMLHDKLRQDGIRNNITLQDIDAQVKETANQLNIRLPGYDPDFNWDGNTVEGTLCMLKCYKNFNWNLIERYNVFMKWVSNNPDNTIEPETFNVHLPNFNVVNLEDYYVSVFTIKSTYEHARMDLLFKAMVLTNENTDASFITNVADMALFRYSEILNYTSILIQTWPLN